MKTELTSEKLLCQYFYSRPRLDIALSGILKNSRKYYPMQERKYLLLWFKHVIKITLTSLKINRKQKTFAGAAVNYYVSNTVF